MRVPVTCILPTFNRIQYLGEAIESILAQTAAPERVLVVDDGSSDTTAALVASFGSRVDYHYKTNGGKSSALNAGLEATTSPYVWIFDDDDVADPDALERMHAALATDETLGFVFGPYRVFMNDGVRTKILGPETTFFPIVEEAHLLVAQLRHSIIHQPGLLVRKRCYDEVGPFDETMLRSQDYEMMLRLTRAFKSMTLREPLFSQRRHAGVRGTAALAIGNNEIQRFWNRFDQKIFRRVHALYALGEFLSKDHFGRELSLQEQISARLERASLMGRRGLWDVAIDDLQAILQIAVRGPSLHLLEQDRNALKRFLDRYSNGLAELMPHLKRLSEVLAEGQGTAIGREMRIYLAWGLPYRLFKDIVKGRARRVRITCRVLAATTSFHWPALLAQKVRTLPQRSASHEPYRNRELQTTTQSARPTSV